MTEVIGRFRKSSYSGQQGNCVEVAATAAGARAIRDSKQQRSPLLTVSRDNWQAFIRQFVQASHMTKGARYSPGALRRRNPRNGYSFSMT